LLSRKPHSDGSLLVAIQVTLTEANSGRLAPRRSDNQKLALDLDAHVAFQDANV
jgi:hypothetical protein